MQCLALQAVPWTFVLPLEGHPGGGDIQAMSYYHPLWQRTEPERGCAIPSLSEEGICFPLVLRTYPGRLARLSEVCPTLGPPPCKRPGAPAPGLPYYSSRGNSLSIGLVRRTKAKQGMLKAWGVCFLKLVSVRRCAESSPQDLLLTQVTRHARTYLHALRHGRNVQGLPPRN